MIFIIGSFCLGVMGLILWQVGFGDDGFGGAVIAWIGFILFAIFLIALPLIWADVRSQIAQFEAVKQTLEDARSNPDISQLELAAIQQKVVDANTWLAKAKYWSKHPAVKIWWFKEIHELEPIK